MKPKILWQDQDMVIITKPSGLLTLPIHGHEESVKSFFPQYFLVHRLDRNTSGLLILAKQIELRIN